MLTLRTTATRTAGALALLLTLGGLACSEGGASGKAATPLAARKDGNGQPLPPGVLARMGSNRLRHGGPVNALVCSPDGKYLASAGTGKVCIWDAATGNLKHRFDFKGDQLRPVSLAFGPAGLIVGGRDGDLSHWVVVDVKHGKILRHIELTGPPVFPVGLVVSPDGKLVAVQEQGCGFIRLYDAATGKQTLRFKLEVQGVFLAFALDGRQIATAGAGFPLDTRIHIHDTTTGKRLHELKKGASPLMTALVFSPDGNTLASVSANGVGMGEGGSVKSVTLWDLRTGKELHRLHAEPWHSPAFSPDGKAIATAVIIAPDYKTEMKLWDVTTGKVLGRYGSGFGVTAAAFTPNGKTLAVAADEGTIHLWHRATGQRLAISANPVSSVVQLRFVGDNQLLGGADDLIIWNATTGREVRRLPNANLFGRNAIGGAILSPDGTLLASHDDKGKILLRKASTGKLVRTLEGSEDTLWHLCFSSDNRSLYSIDNHTTIQIWEVAAGRRVRSLREESGRVGGFAVSPDGRWLASYVVGCDFTLSLWDLVKGQAVRRFPTRLIYPPCFAFSKDGKRLAVAGVLESGDTWEGRVEIWDLTTGRQLHAFRAHHERVDCVAFSPDGRMLATGGDDRTVRLWEVASGQQRGVFKGHEDIIHAVAFAPDGRRLAASSSDAPVFVWDVTGHSSGGERP